MASFGWFPVLAEEVVTVVKETPAQIEVIVRQTFVDEPIMIHIAKCESTFRQYYDSGTVFKGAGRYVGIFQIDEIIHNSAAQSLGFDIYTVEGNIGYANHIFQNEGSRPWLNCSRSYVSVDTPENPATPEEDPVIETNEEVSLVLGSGVCPAELRLSENLKVTDRDGRYSSYQKGEVSEVALLQAHINRILESKYNEASGPVDGIFGPLTKRGVERLQTALNEVLKPAKPLVIDGVVGPYTREAVNNSCGGV